MTTAQMDEKEFLEKAINEVFAETPKDMPNARQLKFMDELSKISLEAHKITNALIVYETDHEEEGYTGFQMNYFGSINTALGLSERAKTLLNQRILETDYE
jgi:hypothetical protein